MKELRFWLGMTGPMDLQWTVADLLREAVTMDGEHHKQWYLERIAELLGVDDLPGHEIGIAP